MRTNRSLLLAAILLPCVFAAAPLNRKCAPESGAPEFAAAQKDSSKETAQDTARAFPIGEQLLYVIEWDPPWYLFFLPSMQAGEIDLKLEGEDRHGEQKALKITFKADSSGVLSKLAGVKIEDVFVFLAEPDTFCSLKTSKSIREGKRKRQIDVEYFRDKRQLHIREVDESAVPPELKKDDVKDNIPACVHNPLSAMYLLRKEQLQANYVRDFVIGYDDRIKEVESRVEKREKVKTPAGEYAAWQIRTTALMGGLFKEGGQFRIWLSADERKLPLQFEVRVKLGRVLGKLKQAPANPKDFQ